MRKILVLYIFCIIVFASENKGEKVFKEYCWGCHHQTFEAFGPSFKTIANKRKKDEIISQILYPQTTYKLLGYKRNAMPSFDDLNNEEIEAIVKYILSFKDKK